MEFRNSVCVVTGGASGIGACSARAFAKLGAKVIVTDINEEDANTVAQEIGGVAHTCDVSDEIQVRALIDFIENSVGPIDLYFKNAGIALGSDPIETPISDWNEQWQVNVMAHVYSIREFLPRMLERGRGYFVHTASMAGIRPSTEILPTLLPNML